MRYMMAIILSSFFLTGCATVYAPPAPHQTITKMTGIYHEVKMGETLWRIAKAYNISVGEISKANRINDGAHISSGQLLFIPGAVKRQAISSYAKDETVPSDFIWPVKGKIISFFGAIRGNVVNKGIDIGAKEGDDIAASRSGRVIFADEKLK